VLVRAKEEGGAAESALPGELRAATLDLRTAHRLFSHLAVLGARARGVDARHLASHIGFLEKLDGSAKASRRAPGRPRSSSSSRVLSFVGGPGRRLLALPLAAAP
jgi:hypothetical protein